MFVMTGGFGLINLCDHIVLAVLAGLGVTPAAPFPLFAECIFRPSVIPSFAFKEVSGS